MHVSSCKIYLTPIPSTHIHSNAFFDSFSADAIWKQDPPPTGDDAVMCFFNDVIGMSTVWDSPDLRPTRLVGKNVGYSFLGWLIIYVSILPFCTQKL